MSVSIQNLPHFLTLATHQPPAGYDPESDAAPDMIAAALQTAVDGGPAVAGPWAQAGLGGKLMRSCIAMLATRSCSEVGLRTCWLRRKEVALGSWRCLFTGPCSLTAGVLALHLCALRPRCMVPC